MIIKLYKSLSVGCYETSCTHKERNLHSNQTLICPFAMRRTQGDSWKQIRRSAGRKRVWRNGVVTGPRERGSVPSRGTRFFERICKEFRKAAISLFMSVRPSVRPFLITCNCTTSTGQFRTFPHLEFLLVSTYLNFG